MGGSVKKQGQMTGPMPHESALKTQKQTGSRQEALGPSFRLLQLSDKLTEHKPGACKMHAGLYQVHASHMQHISGPWLVWATSTHTTALLGGITRILATTSASNWPRAFF